GRQCVFLLLFCFVGQAALPVPECKALFQTDRQSCLSYGKSMWPAFEQTVARYQEVEKLLADPTVIGDRARYTKLAKEHGALARQVKPYQEYEKISADFLQAESLLTAETDPGMRRLIEEELAGLKPRRDALHAKLEDLLLAEGEDFDSIIMEIRAGTG